MRKPFRRRTRPAGRMGCALLLCAVLLCGAAPRPARGEEQRSYTENEWNFIEESMDVSRGIPEDASGALGRIARNGVLRVATVDAGTARVFRDASAGTDAAYDGADIRLAGAIAEKMGVALKIVPLEETQVLLSLSEEQCDLAIASLAYTPGRALAYEMSKSYDDGDHEDTVSLIVRENTRYRIASIEDLENRVIVAQSNSLAEALGALQIRKYKEFRRVFTPSGIYEMVAAGKADAGLVLVRRARAYLGRYPDCGLKLLEDVTLAPAPAFTGNRVAARKGEMELIYFVNGVIDGLTADGSYARWLEEAAARMEAPGL